MAFFLVGYFVIYGSVNLYFLMRARAAFSMGPWPTASLAVFLSAMVIGPIAVHFLEGAGFCQSARWAACVTYIWSAVAFLFLSTGFVIDFWRLIAYASGTAGIRVPGAAVPGPLLRFVIPLAISLLAILYGYFEAADLKVERLSVRTNKIPSTAGKIVVAQISDLHLGLIVRGPYLAKVVEILRANSPDLLLCTGDLVDGQMNRLEGLSEMLAAVDPPMGKYAILGNHEFYAGVSQSIAFIKKSGFKVLRSEVATAGEHMNVAGVDDRHSAQFGAPAPISETDLLKMADRGKFTILMKHRPEIDRVSSGLFDLQLSGHTHKGQIFPFSLLTRLFFQYISGMHRFPSGSWLYVSRGTGTWGPPIRVLSPPEVTIVEIVPEKS